tara:strand:- start:2889 stop:4019 length:1131 start_codon:yes stop_codon:yes gene_type:complete
MLRKVIFWSHLTVGVVCGLVILMMSVTGVLLTYERQILASAESAMHHEPASAAEPLTTAELLAALQRAEPSFRPTSVTLDADPYAPAIISAGRSGRHFVDRYTGAVLPDSAAGARAFFSTITGWHRWFDVEGDKRATARAITGASNLAFLFILFSGIYLWLPPVFNKVAFRTRWAFNPRVSNAKARDYNWHHVFGIWSVVPLIVVVATALVFSYGWANTLLYRAVGDTPPVRGAPRESSGAAPTPVDHRPADDYFTAATQAAAAGWQSLSLSLPGKTDNVVRVAANYGNGGQPQRRTTLVFDAVSAELQSTESFDELPAGRQARSLVRFLHTGEALGIVGQTIAGLVSLISILMVWTGLALAWRRLVSPVLRRRRA